MTARLRLPAYGKALMEARRAGNHPAVVHVLFCEDWRHKPRCEEGCGADHPRLAVKPSEFAAGTLDWRLVTGSLVAVFDDRDRMSLQFSREFYGLLAELGRFAGPVHVYHLDPVKEVGAGVWAFDWRFAFCAGASHWSIDTEQLNEQRRRRWFELRAAAPDRAAA
jgi:hypothetical protein